MEVIPKDMKMFAQNEDETVKVAPNAQFVASHMEAVNHLMLSRKDLREYAVEKGFSDKLLIPADGETCEF